MKELGEYTKELHKDIAKHILTLNIDMVYTIGDEMKYTYDYLKENSKGLIILKHFDDIETLTKEIKEELNHVHHVKNILLKGSTSLGLYKIVDEL